MKLTRRGFLFGLGAVGTLPILPTPLLRLAESVKADLPMLYGDGINCDGEAIEAILKDEPFLVHPNCLTCVQRKGGWLRISEGQLFFKEPFNCRTAKNVIFENLTWTVEKKVEIEIHGQKPSLTLNAPGFWRLDGDL